jgi:hypothetical protein
MTIQDAPRALYEKMFYSHPAIDSLHRKWLFWTKEWVSDDYASWQVDTEKFTDKITQADMVSSRLAVGNQHAPVLDLDVPVHLVPSTTPGHNHLYIDVPMSWRQYKRILNALAAGGVIEDQYAKMSIKRGYSAVRLPWKSKNEARQ